MRGLRSILADRSSASAVLALAILMLLLQTIVSSAMSVASVAASVGDQPVFVICSPLSPSGVLEVAAEHEPTADYHCPLCRVAGVTALPAAIDEIDLGPVFVLELIDRRFVAAEDAPTPPLLTTVLAPDRTGPPTGRI